MTAKIKLNAASGGGSVSIQAPSSSSNNRVIALPDIADGTLLTSQSTLDSTKLSPAIAAGIQQSDIWRSTTSHQGNVSTLANWERPDSGNQGYIGSGMSNSSGTFSFPSTGIYQIQFFAHIYIHNTTSKSQRCTIDIRFTTNNSSYGTVASGHTNFGGGQGFEYIFGSSSSNQTYAIFTRHGDT